MPGANLWSYYNHEPFSVSGGNVVETSGVYRHKAHHFGNLSLERVGSRYRESVNLDYWLRFEIKALEYLGKSQGLQRTRELGAAHASRAGEAIKALSESNSKDVQISRRALVDLTHRAITRTK